MDREGKRKASEKKGIKGTRKYWKEMWRKEKEMEKERKNDTLVERRRERTEGRDKRLLKNKKIK
jgi:hypothetical protein